MTHLLDTDRRCWAIFHSKEEAERASILENAPNEDAQGLEEQWPSMGAKPKVSIAMRTEVTT